MANACFSNAVGIADPDIISDDRMTASSQNDQKIYHPYYGRLNDTRGDGWCAEKPKKEDWLQIRLGKITKICGVATQGDVNGDKWTIDFTLSYPSGNKTWAFYKDANTNAVLVRSDRISFLMVSQYCTVLFECDCLYFYGR